MEFLMLSGLLQRKINRECCSHELQDVFNRREEAGAALSVDGHCMGSENAEKTKIGGDGESKALPYGDTPLTSGFKIPGCSLCLQECQEICIILFL